MKVISFEMVEEFNGFQFFDSMDERHCCEVSNNGLLKSGKFLG